MLTALDFELPLVYNNTMETQPETSTTNNAAISPDQPETATLSRLNRDVAILSIIAGHLNRKIDVHEALQEVLLHVTRLLGLQTGWVWLLDEHEKPYLAARQSLPPYLANYPERMTGSCLCLDTFLQGDLAGAANINVLRCSRLKNAERDKDPSSLGLRFHSSVPIYAGETPIGVLNVASEDWRELAEEELQLLRIIGDQIGLAIQRARLSAEHTRAAARLATIEERNRLAREIHDTLSQGLAAITLQLETADALVITRPERAQDAVRRALSLARANLEEARRSMVDLRAAYLHNRTLPEALATLAREMARQEAIEIEYHCIPAANFPTLPQRQETAIYRIAQEALTNSCKHAHPSRIEMTLEAGEGELCLTVQDDGSGFHPDEVTQAAGAFGSGHFGLIGISERVKLLGGELCIQSEVGAGTCLSVCVPLEEG
ncbi:MAG TPA: GAF domain-containing sensor histidine kinase [Ktedonobacteraceae bacterium]|nr:GAF domain-containing sensor histidine kinase [Ktedonobacteraceae bacterium]